MQEASKLYVKFLSPEIIYVKYKIQYKIGTY